jgi:hypothetical protein
MAMFPSQGLNTKVLVDRISELWVDAKWGTAENFLKQYVAVPLLPTVGRTSHDLRPATAHCTGGIRQCSCAASTTGVAAHYP